MASRLTKEQEQQLRKNLSGSRYNTDRPKDDRYADDEPQTPSIRYHLMDSLVAQASEPGIDDAYID